MPAPRYGAMVKRVFRWWAQFILGSRCHAAFPVGAVGTGALGITDNATPTYLNAMVAIGSWLAQVRQRSWLRWKPCHADASRDFDWRGGTDFLPATRALPAYALLMLIGVLGGFFVVPSMRCYRSGVKKASGRGMRLRTKPWRKQRHVVDAGHLLAGVMVGIPVVPIGIGFGALFALQ